MVSGSLMYVPLASPYSLLIVTHAIVTVGAHVGDLLGGEVGEGVGITVGASVIVGDWVGLGVGKADGIGLGDGLGIRDGLELGIGVEGSFVGLGVGI